MSRAERKQERRVALLEGATRVLAESGLEGFTTGRIAEAAGIGQSGFYVYFEDRDTCLRAVAEHVGSQILALTRHARLTGGTDFTASFVGALQAMLTQRATTTLFLRYRRDPGPLGDAFRSLIARALEELETDMKAMGLFSEDAARRKRMATYCVATTLGAAEGILDGEIADIDTVAAELAGITIGVLIKWGWHES